MTAKATKVPPTPAVGGEAELRIYTPEEVYEKKLLPFRPRTLRDKATAGEIPHTKAGGRIGFTLAHIRETQAMYEVRPLSETKPVTTAA